MFSINSNFLQPSREAVPEEVLWIFESISAVLALYFLIIEIVTAKGVCKHKLSDDEWFELGLNFISPITILIAQFIALCLPKEDFETMKDWYWEVLAWTSFFLWFRFLLMLRSVPSMSPAVSMVLRSGREIKPYFGIVAIGVLAFADAFQSINQIAYLKAAAEIATSDDDYIEPPFDRDMEVEDYTTFKNKYAGEWI